MSLTNMGYVVRDTKNEIGNLSNRKFHIKKHQNL